MEHVAIAIKDAVTKLTANERFPKQRPVMKGRRVIVLAAVAAWLGMVSSAPAQQQPDRLNVVLILVDDLGWTDFACYGSDLHETPNIDKLARDGVKFTQAYSSCTVCSPTRASLLTGKYPARLHVTDWIPGQMPANPKMLVPDWTKYLPLEETTLADVFRSNGYATVSLGKWHLGGPEYYPEKHGFDGNIGGTHLPQPPVGYFAPWKIDTLSEGKPGDYLTDRLGDEAVRYLQDHKDRPFFLYFPHYGVHTPIQGRADLVEKYNKKLRPGLEHHNPAYAAMVESVDETVGRVRKTLADLGIADRTIVVVASDNGGRVPTTSNKPLRAGKGSCYEGGVRVPLIISWPGVTKPGGVCDAPVITADLYPTLLQATGLKDAPEHRPDGVSLVPLLRRTGDLKRDALFWHYPHHQHYQQGGTMPYSAVREGDLKLIEQLDDGRLELYNLCDDPGEQHDLAAEKPDVARRLRDRLQAWREEGGAQMPTPNPNYDPAKPQHIPRPKKAEAEK
ncbi:sulfatase [Paludisphaera rhizosphaerae]|uniref:sulfatase n=1 Tax=Paludisphaera rhizosphaerae TaxID=2711216 RepID=UPI0013EC232F|nr:sulfatase [Paludisphaera rhizosphaerae]